MVQADDTLCMEIRDNAVNIYYRGGSLLRVDASPGGYSLHFDFEFCLDNGCLWPAPDQAALASPDSYIASLPLFKREMDYWFSRHPKPERETQQLILRTNNLCAVADDTDYIIADIEYADTQNASRFDMTGAHVRAKVRGGPDNAALALFEVKYGDGALAGSAGIQKHYADILRFAQSGGFEALAKETQEQLNQKAILGLLRNTARAIRIDTAAKPEFILICAEHNPASTVLRRELHLALDLCPSLPQYVELKVATASHTGFGLYTEKVVPLAQYLAQP